MPDILIRDVPEDVLTSIDSAAERAGLSRSEYLRRRLALDADRQRGSVTVEDLERSARAFADLDDPDVMSRAWA